MQETNTDDKDSFGRKDSRGNWSPDKPISYGPVFTWPPKPKVLFKWFFGLRDLSD